MFLFNKDAIFGAASTRRGSRVTAALKERDELRCSSRLCAFDKEIETLYSNPSWWTHNLLD